MAQTLFMNRRGTEPYARWCERTGEVTPPSYSILGILNVIAAWLPRPLLGVALSVQAL
ncbi:hypothetical protein HHSLTHF2_18060 [Vreelandella venusta]|uniref:Uncharacterized protein n=1 Tax=Halomonas hydrothermalis TaxID=115561 RepID=A0A6F8U455_9GAMM|nr:hypothetical protein HHSLTHF2_18060 [Halomonas hydrothermalis]